MHIFRAWAKERLPPKTVKSCAWNNRQRYISNDDTSHSNATMEQLVYHKNCLQYLELNLLRIFNLISLKYKLNVFFCTFYRFSFQTTDLFNMVKTQNGKQWNSLGGKQIIYVENQWTQVNLESQMMLLNLENDC